MVIKGMTQAQIEAAASDAGVSVVVRTLNQKGTRHRVKVNPSGKKDADRNRRWQRISPWRSSTGNHRRVHAVCWHGFRDFFRACFAREPDAEMRTALDHWRGSADFEARYRESGTRNVGSIAQPACAADVCLCPERGLAV